MSRYIGPSCRLCRREGTKLFLKGDRCLSQKCAVDRRGTAPGPHGTMQKKPKEYGTQMREKQKARRYYGVQERQFANYYVKSATMPGVTGINLLMMLERRLDNVIYRMGMAESRKEARQLLIHGHFRLNGKKVTAPSLQVKVGDVVTLRDESRGNAKIKGLIESLDSRISPKWLEIDKTNVKATVKVLPSREDVDFPFEEDLITEYYSK